MKKVFLLTALVAGIMSSCSEDDFGSASTPVDNNTIAFSTRKSSPVTRSGETITSINKFTVSAVNEDNSPFFSREEFTYDADLGVFRSQTPHYWPTTGTLSFYAISTVGTHSVDINNIPSYTYTNWAGEKDLVAATVKAGEKTMPYPLAFKHLTSQILVSAEAMDQTQELTYKLIDVKLQTPSTGVYSFADATGGVGTWQIDNSQTSEYSYATALPKTFRQNGQVELSSCYWNILPVTDGSMIFTVEYQVLQNGVIISDNTGANAKSCTVSAPNLEAGKRYNYNFQLSISTQDEITFTTTISDWTDGSSTNLKPQGPPAESIAVDLGLSVKWAQGNLGSTEETDEGLYYVWDVNPTGYAKDSGHSFSNYSSSLRSDLTLEQDAAHVKLGGTWRMPTKTELEELINNTTHTFTKVNGVSGCKFTASNGNYIFMPSAGGFINNSENISGWSSTGYYLSSTHCSYGSGWGLKFNSSYNLCQIDSQFYYYGLSIRAVCD